jgi:hypothetical protein
MSRVENPYGDGFASRRIATQLVADQTGGISPIRPFVAASPVEASKESAEGVGGLSLPEYGRCQ